MQNMYETLKDHLHFNKFVKEELLCVEYTCPIVDEDVDIWSQMDYIIHVLSGKKSWRTLDGTFEVNAGDTVYIKKGAAFIKQFFDDDFCMLAFFLSDDLIREALKDVKGDFSEDQDANTDFHILYVKDDQLLNAYFQGMLHHFQDKAKPLDTLLDLKFKELVINLMIGNKSPELTRYFLNIAKNSQPPLSYIMEQNYSFNLSMEEFARLSHRSLSSFKRDFQEHYKITPGKWLISKRLDRAAVLLRDDSLNIAQVAYQSGFKDNSHFGRSFKEKFGKTPLDYRGSLKTTES